LAKFIRDLRDALAERAAMPKSALNLLQVIADPECDPNDFAADGITVFQVIQRDAQETLAAVSEPKGAET
jgi:hypothetical protein